MDCADDVLDFWFPSIAPDDRDGMTRQLEWWFRGGADAEIDRRFRRLHEHAGTGVLHHWADRPRNRLALILVMDQFSRSIHRGTARAYALDPLARSLTREGIAAGHYSALVSRWEKTFFFLPLGHSEDLGDLDEAVRLAEDLAHAAPSAERALLLHSAAQARGHREVVARFGRQPHRNAVLGRASTPEEIEYLARGDFVHQRQPPRRAG